MPAPSFALFTGFERPALSRRAIALLLAIAIHGLLILMLLTLAPDRAQPKKERREPVNFSLDPAIRPAWLGFPAAHAPPRLHPHRPRANAPAPL